MNTRYFLTRGSEKPKTNTYMYIIFMIGVAVIIYFVFLRELHQDHQEAPVHMEAISIVEDENIQGQQPIMRQEFDEENNQIMENCKTCRGSSKSVDVDKQRLAFTNRGIKLQEGPDGWDPAIDTVVYDGATCQNPYGSLNPYMRYPYSDMENMDMAGVAGWSQQRRYT